MMAWHAFTPLGEIDDIWEIAARWDDLLSSLCFRQHEYTAFLGDYELILGVNLYSHAKQ